MSVDSRPRHAGLLGSTGACEHFRTRVPHSSFHALSPLSDLTAITLILTELTTNITNDPHLSKASSHSEAASVDSYLKTLAAWRPRHLFALPSDLAGSSGLLSWSLSSPPTSRRGSDAA